MIKDYAKFTFKNLTCEANYDETSTPCKTILFTIDGHTAVVNKSDLYALLMLYADDEEMADMVTVREKKVKMIRKAVKVTAKEDIAKGADVIFTIEYPVDEWIYEKQQMDEIEMLSQEEAIKKLS